MFDVLRTISDRKLNVFTNANRRYCCFSLFAPSVFAVHYEIHTAWWWCESSHACTRARQMRASFWCLPALNESRCEWCLCVSEPTKPTMPPVCWILFVMRWCCAGCVEMWLWHWIWMECGFAEDRGDASSCWWYLSWNERTVVVETRKLYFFQGLLPNLGISWWENEPNKM